MALALLAIPVIVIGFLVFKPHRSRRSGRATPNEPRLRTKGGNNAHPSSHAARRLGGHRHCKPGLAQNYPRRAVQLIVAFPAGGSTDVGARILAGLAEKDFGQPMTVVNKAGAGGQIGFTEAARARPDGYTLCFLNLPGMNTITLDPERKAAFTIDSFIPIVNQVLDPGFIWVKGDSPYKTLADLVDAAKKNPGKISACTTGILSDDHLAILMVQEAAKPSSASSISTAAQQLTGVLGGHVDVAFDNVGSVFKRVAPARSAGSPSPTPSARSSCRRSRPPRSWACRR